MSQSRFPATRGASRMPTASEGWNDWFPSFFPSFFQRAVTTGAVAPVDVCEQDNDFVIRMACAGCRPEDIDVTAENDTIRIRGKFPDFEGTWMGNRAMGMQGNQSTSQQTNPQQTNAQQFSQQQSSSSQNAGQSGMQHTGSQRGSRENCLIQELPSGRFERDIVLPVAIDAQKANASFENGLLILTLPRAQSAQGHRIQVGTGSMQSGQQGYGMSSQPGAGMGTQQGTGMGTQHGTGTGSQQGTGTGSR